MSRKDSSEQYLELLIGKLNVTHGVSSHCANDRVPFTGSMFHPTDPTVFALVGGPMVSIYRIPQRLLDLAEPAKDANETYEQTESCVKYLHMVDRKLQVQPELLQRYSFHSPNLVARAYFSELGDLVATCDPEMVSIWRWADNVTLMSKKVPDVFDCAFLGDHYIVVGSIGWLLFYTISDFDCFLRVKVPEKTFIRSLATSQVTSNSELDQRSGLATYRIAISTNTVLSATYEITLPKIPQTGIQKVEGSWIGQVPEKFYDTLTVDTPIPKIPSFSPCGRFVAFPFTERYRKHFALVLELDSDADHYRFRGHLQRVCCVAFGNRIRSRLFDVDKIVENQVKVIEDKDNNYDDLVSQLKRNKIALKLSSLLPEFTVFAMASVEGVLSIWLFLYSNNENEPAAYCLFVTTESITDSNSVVTALSWSCDDSHLLVTSYDGKATLIELDFNGYDFSIVETRNGNKRQKNIKDLTFYMPIHANHD